MNAVWSIEIELIETGTNRFASAGRYRYQTFLYPQTFSVRVAALLFIELERLGYSLEGLVVRVGPAPFRVERDGDDVRYGPS